MPYSKTNWVDGSEPAITADKLNNLEKQYEEALNFVKDFGLGTYSKGYFGDLNDLKTNGMYYAWSEASNKPSSNNGYVLVLGILDDHTAQIFINSAGGTMYRRVLVAGVWQPWVKFLTKTEPLGTVASMYRGNFSLSPNVNQKIIFEEVFTDTGLAVLGGSHFKIPTEGTYQIQVQTNPYVEYSTTCSIIVYVNGVYVRDIGQITTTSTSFQQLNGFDAFYLRKDDSVEIWMRQNGQFSNQVRNVRAMITMV